MTDSLYLSNESHEHINSLQEDDFANKTIEEILSTLDDSIVDKANKLMKITECKENYKEKIRILNNHNESIRQIRDMPPLVLKRSEDLSFLKKENILEEGKDKTVDSIINKAIVMKRIPRVLNFYRQQKIPKNNIVIKANMNEIKNGLDTSNFKNAKLSNIGKILRWTRFNFNGIILEEGKNWENIIKKGNEYITTEEKNPEGEVIIHKGETVLMRHLEEEKINPEIMETALKEWIAFYEEYFKKEYFTDDEENNIKKIKYIKSGSWLRNREFRKFYKDKIWDPNKPGKTNNIQKTLELLEKMWTIFVTRTPENKPQKQEKENNDRFLRIPLRTPTEDDKNLHWKEIDKKLIEIKTWFNTKRISEGDLSDTWEEITKNNINPEIVSKLKKQRNIDKKDDEVKINGTVIARILWWKPIESGICILPIEKLKK